MKILRIQSTAMRADVIKLAELSGDIITVSVSDSSFTEWQEYEFEFDSEEDATKEFLSFTESWAACVE